MIMIPIEPTGPTATPPDAETTKPPIPRKTLIDWSKEGTEKTDRYYHHIWDVRPLCLNVKGKVRLALQEMERSDVSTEIPADILERFRKDYQNRLRIIEEWDERGGPSAVHAAAERFREIARGIDLVDDATKDLPIQEKLSIFFQRCGGRQAFEDVYEALGKSGCFCDIAGLLFIYPGSIPAENK